MSNTATQPVAFNFEAMEFHKPTEKLVQYLATRANSKDFHFIRVITAFYLGLVATSMRNQLLLPGNRPVPLNIYAVGLLPSGQGKGVLTSEFENVILRPLVDTFHTIWKDKRETLIALEAQNAANRFQTQPEDEEKAIRKAIEALGVPLLYFEEGTSPAFKQARSALLRVPYGGLNFIVDECFGVDAANAEVMEDMIKTYDVGSLKQKLIKHSSDNPRHIDGAGTVPTNMLLFGTGSHLDDPITHTSFCKRLESGLARRSHFAFTRESEKIELTAQQKLANLNYTSDPANVAQFTSAIATMILPTKENLTIYMDEACSLYLLEYQNYCEKRAKEIKDKILRAEMTHRYMKVVKTAGLYAAYDNVEDLTIEHLQAAMKMTEQGDEHIARIVHTIPPHARLAEFLAAHDGELTMAQLVTKLPWFKGSVAVREEMLQLASEYGYSNSIIINQEKRNGITFISGEGIKPTDLNQILLSYGNHDAYNYLAARGPWKDVGKLVTQQGIHWTTHWFEEGHRTTENVIPGFNLIALDVDNSAATSNVPMKAAMELLSDYTYLMYESKSSTPEFNRYRIVLPTSHVLKLSEEVYAKFMTNIYDWLPIPLDEVTNQRNRKWLGYNSTPHYNEGLLLPVLDFIPETEQALRVQKQTVALGDLSHVERWVVRSIDIDGAPRNNALIKYAFILVDANLDQEAIELAVLTLNKKLSRPLPEEEIKSTIFRSVGNKIAQNIQED